MPTYVYRCAKCGEETEAVQKMSDPPLKRCKTCKGALKRVFQPVGIVLKGSGFYKTDSRAAAEKKAAAASSSSESKSSDSTETKSTDSGAKSESKSTESKPTESKSSADSKPAKKTPSTDS